MSEQTQKGPCKICGATEYGLSFGGPDVCPACDCGIDPAVSKLQQENAALLAQNAALVEALKNLLKNVQVQGAGWPSVEQAEQALEAPLIAPEGIKEVINGDTSDGYHTFNELYDHRCLLWINFCHACPIPAYVVEEHFQGWFLLGMETPYGQISYHCPNKFLHLVKDFRRSHPDFDGHTSKDVIERLEKMAALSAAKGDSHV